MEAMQQQMAQMQEALQRLGEQNQELHQRLQASESREATAASTSLPPGHSPRGHAALINDVRDIGKPK